MAFRILVVDDNKISRETVQTLLVDAGWLVDGVDNAIQALANINHTDYDLVITGYYMPVIDGPHLTGLIKTRHDSADLPVIMLSTRSEADVAAAMDMQLLSMFLRKPLNCDAKRQLLDHISTLIVATSGKAA
ncbi:response regulator [Shewanella sp. NIFS-20-20]|uniref:response regulator n=1 Tax=Shewanella sp. NIFS-20-20 TaxID=2853806 RepID=UPI001C461D5E|nr:response regulator [Shewanella sp. NIFS-20-20]MBV7315148.1 response regulator [Shewanella sp. NIFS-20-20]